MSPHIKLFFFFLREPHIKLKNQGLLPILHILLNYQGLLTLENSYLNFKVILFFLIKKKSNIILSIIRRGIHVCTKLSVTSTSIKMLDSILEIEKN